MIIAIQHEDMGSSHLCTFYDNLVVFIQTKFKVEIIRGEDSIRAYIDDKECPNGWGLEFTNEEVLNQFTHSPFIKAFIRSKFYTVYDVSQIV